MSIVYLGDDQRVKGEFAEAREALDMQYRKVLGEERVKKLDGVTSRVINQQSFYSDPKRYRADMSQDIGGSNKFIIGTEDNLELDATGKLKRRKVSTFPLFYISESGFQASGSASFTERRLVSFVHEFNHYVWYALQRVPIYVTSIGISHAINSGPEASNFRDIIPYLLEADMSRQELLDKLALAIYGMVSNEVYERSNKILDKLILGCLGVNIDLPWRHVKRTYMPLPIVREGHPSIFMVPSGGDLFANISDEEVLDRVVDWENYAKPMIASNYIQNFLQSVKDLRVSRLSYSQMRELVGQKKR